MRLRRKKVPRIDGPSEGLEPPQGDDWEREAWKKLPLYSSAWIVWAYVLLTQ